MVLEKVLKAVSKNAMMQYFSYNMLASLFVQIRSFIFIWIATQQLSVNDYGIFALVLMLIMTTSDLADMGGNSAVTRFSSKFYNEKKYAHESAIIYLAFKRKIINCFFVVAVLIVFSNQIATILLENENYHYLISLSSIGVIFALFYGLNVSILQGRKLFKDYFKVVGYISFISLGVLYISLFYCKISIEFLIGYHIAILGGSFLFSFLIMDFSQNKFLNVNFSDIKIKKSFNNFGFWMFLWAIFSVLQSKIDMIMLSQLANIEEIAYYDIAMKFTKPLLMVFSAYGQVLNPVIASFKDKNDLVKQIKNSTKFIYVMTLIIAIFIGCSGYVIYLVFGEKYANSIFPLKIILVALIFFVWTMPYNSVLYAMNKPHIFTIAAILTLFSTITGNCFLLNKYGAIGAAITFLFAQIIGFLVSLIFYKKHLKKYEFKEKGIEDE